MTGDPTGTHEAVEAAIPRQRDAGVMGYVAELQQFDDSMTASTDEQPDGRRASADAEPSGAAGHAPPSGPDVAAAVDGASGGARGPAGHGSPGTGAASGVPDKEGRPPRSPGSSRTAAAAGVPKAGKGVPKKEGRPPWTRTEVGLAIAFVVVAAVAILGGGYAVLMANRPPTGEVQLPLPPVEAAGEQDPPASAEPTPDAARGAGPEPSRSAAPGGGADPSTVDSSEPAAEASPTAAASPPAADLFASYSRAENTGLLGLTGYRGEVTIANRGLGAADGWTVTLSLPAGQKVDGVVGADARQDGTLVTFTPLAGRGEVAAGGSVSFTFDVPGLLAGEPTGCAINGRPCE